MKLTTLIKTIFKSQSSEDDAGSPNPDIEDIFKSCLRSLDSGETSLTEEGIKQFANNNSVPKDKVPEFVSRVAKHKNMQKSSAGQEGAEAGAFNDAQLEELQDAFTEIHKSITEINVPDSVVLAAGEILEGFEPRLKALEDQNGEMQELLKSKDEAIEALQGEVMELKKSTAELEGEVKDPKDVGLEGTQAKPKPAEDRDDIIAAIKKGREAGELTGDDLITYDLTGRKTEPVRKYLAAIEK
jgi:hypothetical protein